MTWAQGVRMGEALDPVCGSHVITRVGPPVLSAFLSRRFRVPTLWSRTLVLAQTLAEVSIPAPLRHRLHAWPLASPNLTGTALSFEMFRSQDTARTCACVSRALGEDVLVPGRLTTRARVMHGQCCNCCATAIGCARAEGCDLLLLARVKADSGWLTACALS